MALDRGEKFRQDPRHLGGESMQNREFTEENVEEALKQIVGAFQGEFGFQNLRFGAEALFRDCFYKSVSEALFVYRLDWHGDRPTLEHLPEFRTWREFIVELIRRVALDLVRQGYGSLNKVDREAMRATILKIGADHGCPPAVAPKEIGRWCSFFIK